MTNILVAEDDPAIGRILDKILCNAGYEVELVTDGQDAFQQAAYGSADLDLLISDLSMPNWNGLETINSLALVVPDLKIIVVSAYLSESRYSEPLKEAPNVVGVLPKPFKNTVLLEMVAAALDSVTHE